MQIHKLTVPHLTTDVMYIVWLGHPSNICFINVCIYLLKLVHIKQAYSILSMER